MKPSIDKMTLEKKLCCLVMLCQMTAILSGVAMLYLAVIVIIPSKTELQMGISISPIMCSTVHMENVNLLTNPDGTPADCEWASCREWCLSKDPALCLQIHVRPRLKGANVTLEECETVNLDENCSALNISWAVHHRCKKGECTELNGIYNCERTEFNNCSYITPAYECRSNITREGILCTDEKCEKPLQGVYYCEMGECFQLSDVTDYKQCKRKCSDLSLEGYNTLMFSKEHIIGRKCKSVTSTNGTTEMKTLSDSESWLGSRDVLMVFCTYVSSVDSVLYGDDCFNATLGDSTTIATITDYVDLQQYHINSDSRRDWLIDPEETLEVLNQTVKLLMNSEGCSNTLAKECTQFFIDHKHDERDGRTRDRFPCYYSEETTEFVTAVYRPDETRMYLILASCVPSGLFIFSCGCLYLCSKLITSNDEGHLAVRSFKKDAADYTYASDL